MRNVPKLRFKEFCEEWEEKRLENLCNNFIVPMRDKPKNLDGIIPWCRIEDFEGKYLLKSKSNQGVSIETVKEMNLKVFPIDTLLVSCSANLGRCAIIKKELITNQTFIGLVPKKDKINIEYFYYLMLLQERKLNLMSSGTTISYLSKDEFKNFKILLSFNLQEQQKIADFLSSIDKKISITEEKLDLFKDYKKGIMQKIFNQELRFKDSNGNDYPEWEEKRLEEITNCLTGYPFDSEKFNELKLGFPLIRIRNLLNSNISTYYNGMYEEKYVIKKNDILIGMDGDFHTIKWNNENSLLNQRIMKISSKNNLILDNNFLFYIIKKPIEKINLKVSATTVKHLSTKDVFNIKIQLPCLEEQQKIADFLSSIDKKIDNLTSELEDLKEFKKGLLQQMFI